MMMMMMMMMMTAVTLIPGNISQLDSEFKVVDMHKHVTSMINYSNITSCRAFFQSN